MRILPSAATLVVAVVVPWTALHARASRVASGIQQIHVDTARVRIPGGSLYYEEAGHGSAVVLLQSGNFDSRTWDPRFLPLARTHRVIRYDARGLGRSSPAETPYAAHDDLLALLDSLRISRTSLVGISGGARIAIDSP